MFAGLLLFSILLVQSDGTEGEAGAPAPSLDALLSRDDFRKYERKPKYKDRMDLFRDAFSDQADQLKNHIREKHLKPARDALGRMQVLARYALEEPTREAASPKDLRSNQVRKFEIRLRKLVGTLQDFKQSVPYEYRQDFDVTIQEVETLRDSLLKQLFELG